MGLGWTVWIEEGELACYRSLVSMCMLSPLISTTLMLQSKMMRIRRVGSLQVSMENQMQMQDGVPRRGIEVWGSKMSNHG